MVRTKSDGYSTVRPEFVIRGVLFWTNGSVALNYMYPEQTPDMVRVTRCSIKGRMRDPEPHHYIRGNVAYPRSLQVSEAMTPWNPLFFGVFMQQVSFAGNI